MPWRVMCRVSGGVTGTRGPVPLKLGGVEQVFRTKAEAQAAAEAAKRFVSPYAKALFEYWPEEVKE